VLSGFGDLDSEIADGYVKTTGRSRECLFTIENRRKSGKIDEQLKAIVEKILLLA